MNKNKVNVWFVDSLLFIFAGVLSFIVVAIVVLYDNVILDSFSHFTTYTIGSHQMEFFSLILLLLLPILFIISFGHTNTLKTKIIFFERWDCIVSVGFQLLFSCCRSHNEIFLYIYSSSRLVIWRVARLLSVYRAHTIRSQLNFEFFVYRYIVYVWIFFVDFSTVNLLIFTFNLCVEVDLFFCSGFGI